ncbi:hypothetical protein OC845_005125 [Tilletia horrida]|nr:hypothetical protein OC845_005125 [Tilletia horrida]
MVSVASFESLPEDEALGIQFPQSPTLSDHSASSFVSPKSDMRRFPALPPSPRLRTSFSVAESPPTSPDLPRTVVSASGPQLQHKLTRPKSNLKRSSTDPYGMGKEFETLMSKRRFVAMELLDTERAYMQSLKLLDENFLKPMQAASIGQVPSARSKTPCPQLSRKVISEIFSNFTNIYTLNKELLAQLEQRLTKSQEEGRQLSDTITPLNADTPSLGGTSIQRTRSISSTRSGRPISVASADSSGSGSLGVAAGSSDVMLNSGSPASMSPSGSSIMSHQGSSSGGTIITTTGGWSPREDLIGDILVPIAPFLSMYKLFAQNFSNSLARIEAERKRDDSFARFVKAAERAAWAGGPGAAGFGLGFEAHLLTIVQRITRYKMLIADLVKFTPEGHPDRQDLVKSLSIVSQIAHDCDYNIKTHEMVLLMLNLQRSLIGLNEPLVVPGRALLRQGALLKTCRKNIQPREFFLFTDCIMYASPVSGGLESSASAAWQAMVGSSLSSVWGGSTSAAGTLANEWGVSSAAAAASGAAAGKRMSFYSGAAGGMTGGFGAGAAVAAAAASSFGVRTRTNSASAAEQGGGINSSASTNGIVAPLTLSAQPLQFRSKIALQDCTVVSVDTAHLGLSSTIPEGLRYAFELRTPEKSFALYAESQESKEAWMTRIREAKEAHMIARRTLRAEEDSIEAKRERRRSLYRDQKMTSAAAASAARSALRLSMPLGNHSSSNITTVREGEPFPTNGDASNAGSQSPLSLGGALGSGALDSAGAGPRSAGSSTPASATSPLFVQERERPRLNSLQSIASVIPTPSLAALLSPSLGGGIGNASSTSLSGVGAGILGGGGASSSSSSQSLHSGPKPLKVMEEYNAPVWVPDSHADKCAVCGDAFGLWRRKHHCRLCGQVVCWSCSQRTFLIPSYQDGVEDQQARACTVCFDSVFPPSEDESGSPPDTAVPLPPAESTTDSDDTDADRTTRASQPLPLPSSSTPLFRPRPISVRVDSDATSPASSPATTVQADSSNDEGLSLLPPLQSPKAAAAKGILAESQNGSDPVPTEELQRLELSKQ